MKLAFVVPGFSADEADWCIPSHTELIRALAAGHDVHVFALRYPHRVDRYPIGSACVHSLNGVGQRGLGSFGLWQRARGALALEHRARRFDVIHSFFGSEAGAVAVLSARSLGVPAVVWLIDGELAGLRDIGYGADLSARQRLMNALILRWGERVLCGCESLAEAARARIPSSRRARVVTFPLPVNTSRFSPTPHARSPETEGQADAAHASPARLINAGSLTPVKDQANLLRALAQLRPPFAGAHLTIAGEGPLAGELNALAAELGLEAHVRLVGAVSHAELPEVYRAHDLFVQSSRHEGQGMALLEAAACGCAVCGTDAGILHDLAQRGLAMVAPPGEPAALARAIESALAARASAHTLSEFVRREYNLDRIVHGLLELDHNIVAP